jgi:hypothetical protein
MEEFARKVGLVEGFVERLIERFQKRQMALICQISKSRSGRWHLDRSIKLRLLEQPAAFRRHLGPARRGDTDGELAGALDLVIDLATERAIDAANLGASAPTARRRRRLPSRT